MSNPKGRTLPNAFSMYFAMLAICCLDLFVFRSDLTVLGDAFFSRFFSFIILFLYIKASKNSFSVLGISKKKEKFIAGGVYGALFSLVPLILVILCEVIYFTSSGSSGIRLIFSPPGIDSDSVGESITPFGVAIIYTLTTIFGTAFKEFFFRGFMLKNINKITGFFKANLLQSLLYTSFIVAVLVRNFIRGDYNSAPIKLTVFIVVSFIAHEMISGIKRGLVTRVSGSTYIATVEHFICVFVSNSIFITARYEEWGFMLRITAIQLVSLIMVIVYYAVGMKRINAKKLRAKKEAEEARARKEERRKEREANRVIKEKIAPLEAISPENYRSIASDAKRKSHEDPNAPLESTVFIEDAIREKPTEGDSADSDVDGFLKEMTREMRRREKPTRSDEITEDFDSDDFLEAYQNGKTHGNHRYSGHSHHRSHHHSDKETARKSSASEKVPTPKPTKKKLSQKPKRTLAQKIRSLGGVDDSSSNDLI